MSQILAINIGHCGLELGKEIWEGIIEEQNINKNGSIKQDSKPQGNMKPFFSEIKKDVFQARSIFFDFDQNSIDSIKSQEIAKLFDKENFLSGKNIYSTGTYAQGH